jgi:F-type H+-transporting ATPase subunit b
MLIDWFTVAAQMLNFVILVWLLKRFLYRPILDALDAREKRIAAELADAAAKQAAAQMEREEFQRKNEELNQNRTALMNQAAEVAGAERERLLAETRKTADDLRIRRLETLQNDARNLNLAISRRTRQEVFAITRKALEDLAGASLEDRMSEVFIRRLRALDGPARETLDAALRTASEPALVRSAFELPAARRAAIQAALNNTFSTAIQVRFETTPDLVGGIELTANGQKVAWSIADYVGSLEKNVSVLLDKDATPGPLTEDRAKPDPTSTSQ